MGSGRQVENWPAMGVGEVQDDAPKSPKPRRNSERAFNEGMPADCKLMEWDQDLCTLFNSLLEGYKSEGILNAGLKVGGLKSPQQACSSNSLPRAGEIQSSLTYLSQHGSMCLKTATQGGFRTHVPGHVHCITQVTLLIQARGPKKTTARDRGECRKARQARRNRMYQPQRAHPGSNIGSRLGDQFLGQCGSAI